MSTTNSDKVFSKAYVAKFYHKQLKKFDKIGPNKETKNLVHVTPNLIKVIKKRL